MMASNRGDSLHDSVHTSSILQQQENRKRDLNQHQEKDKTDIINQLECMEEAEIPSPSIPLYIKLLLTACFAGNEMATCFSMIYNLLLLQFLGVPTKLMTISGAVAGCGSIICLPITGWLVDRAASPLKRKMKMMGFCLATYILGFSGLAICSVTKFNYKTGVRNLNSPNLSYLNTTITIFDDHHLTKDNNASTNQLNITGDYIDKSGDVIHEQIVSYIPVFGILSFSLVDFSYDTSNTLCRNYVFECFPPEMHTQLLITITAVGSFSGFLFALTGTFNLPGMLGPAFHVDGTAATMFLLSTGLLFIIISTYFCTMLTGKWVHSKFVVQKVSKSYWMINKEIPSGLTQAKREQETKRSLNVFDQFIKKLHKVEYNQSTGLLREDYLDIRSYSAISDYSLAKNNDKQNWSQSEDCNEKRRNVLEIATQVYGTIDDGYGYSIHESSENLVTYKKGNIEAPLKESENSCKKASEIITEDTAMETPFYMPASLIHSTSNGNTHKNTPLSVIRNESNLTVIENSSSAQMKNSIWKNRYLYILLVSMFCSMFALDAFTGYSGNTLTVGIYHGDPTSLPGTDGRKNYEKGFRMTSLGNMIMFSTYALAGVVNGKILNIFGEKAYFIASHLAFLAACLSFLLTKLDELYVLASAFAGFYRTCSFTLIYIMAHKLVKSEYPKSGTSSNQAEQMAKVMTAIGFILPAAYLILSIIAGPLISVTGSVWTAVVIQIASITLAVFVFLFGLVI